MMPLSSLKRLALWKATNSFLVVIITVLRRCEEEKKKKGKHEKIFITDRHPNPLFSVCIISPNAERKIMQTNCVRKTGAVFFGGREIFRGNLTLAKSTHSIIETRSNIKPRTSCIIKNNAACFSFNSAACFSSSSSKLVY